MKINSLKINFLKKNFMMVMNLFLFINTIKNLTTSCIFRYFIYAVYQMFHNYVISLYRLNFSLIHYLSITIIILVCMKNNSAECFFE